MDNSDLEWQEQQHQVFLKKLKLINQDECIKCNKCSPKNGKEFKCDFKQKVLQ